MNNNNEKKQLMANPWKIVRDFWWLPLVLCLVVSLVPRRNNASSEYAKKYPATVELTVGENKIDLERPDTVEKKRVGIRGRDDLPDDRGMLFPLTGSSKPFGITMAGIGFPVDFVFGAGSYLSHVITLQPCGQNCPEIKVDKDADYFVVLKGGMARKLGIKPGIRVILAEKKTSGS